MSQSFFIGDGYTEDGFFRAVDGLYPELTFSYRPLTVSERNQFSTEIKHKSDADVDATAAKFLARHIVSWSAPGEPTEEQINKLRPALFDRLWQTAVGRMPHDGANADREADAKN